ncbi:MAG: hypothetical protein NVSMB32_06960 [Actinomycetota bacterium]
MPEILVGSLLDVLVAQGLVHAVTMPDGPGFVGLPGMAAIAGGRARPFQLGDLRSTVLQGADLVERARTRDLALDGCAYTDPAVLQAQGLRSAEAVAKLAAALIPRLEGLDARLQGPGRPAGGARRQLPGCGNGGGRS